jgi:pyruvate dehydrogenase E2 component (dihydrolipoamide acetyltransferase)
MAVEVILPKVDMDMATGTIAKWHVKDGDTVKKGQALFDIETDKSAMEIESPGDGMIKIGRADTNVAIDIGSVVAMIYAKGEVVSENVTPSLSNVIPAKAGTQLSASSAPAKLDPRLRGDDEVDGSGKIRATPLARRLAKQHGVSLLSLKGSGPRGRITSADVQKVELVKPVSAPLQPAADASATRALYKDGSYEVKPLDGMRRTIAQRLQHSKQTVPHFYLSATCTIDILLATRERLNASAPRGADTSPQWKLSINDFVIKAFALALQKVPAANTTFTDDGILFHTTSDVGVAVSVEGGLFTPIVRSAESKSLSAISIEMKELAAKARNRKLQAPEYQAAQRPFPISACSALKASPPSSTPRMHPFSLSVPPLNVSYPSTSSQPSQHKCR